MPKLRSINAFLTTANAIGYAELPSPWGPAVAVTAGLHRVVEPFQYAGASLLLAGSILYTAWALLVPRNPGAQITEPLAP